jgi:peroxiredoxin
MAGEIARRHADEFLSIATSHPEDPAAIDALSFVVLSAPLSPQGEKAAELLARDHIQSERLSATCWKLVYSSGYPWSKPIETLLRQILEKSPHRTIQAAACYSLALRYESEAKGLLTLKQSIGDKVTPRGERYRANLERVLGADALKELAERNPEESFRSATTFFERITEQYADVEVPGKVPKDGVLQTITLGELADDSLGRIRFQAVGMQRNLSIGTVAPEIEGEDLDGKPMKLSDYRGKVVVLDFWSLACAPCLAMKPHERAMVKRLEGKPFALLSIPEDTDRQGLKSALQKKEITWRSWFDGDGRIASQWLVLAVPTIYVIDTDGVIRFKDVRGEELDRAVDSLLEKLETTR